MYKANDHTMIKQELLDDLLNMLKEFPNIKMDDEESGLIELNPNSEYEIYFFIGDDEFSISANLKDPKYKDAFFWSGLYWVNNNLNSEDYLDFKDTLRNFAKYPTRIIRDKGLLLLSFRAEYYNDNSWHPIPSTANLLFPFFEKIKDRKKKVAIHYSDLAYINMP